MRVAIHAGEADAGHGVPRRWQAGVAAIACLVPPASRRVPLHRRNTPARPTGDHTLASLCLQACRHR
ncbi:hypothetical protein PSNTI_34450 [Stutzerimonas stutzeri]|nr:hypothetical protein PSNTI_34450 [Stutzerimonas stutzeri]